MADNNDNITLEQLRDFAARADERLDNLEASRPKGQSLTLASDGWTNDSGDENYPYQYVLTVDGVTTASRADAVLDDESLVIASASGVCATCKTADSTVIFKSYTVPAAALTGTLYITKKAAVSGT